MMWPDEPRGIEVSGRGDPGMWGKVFGNEVPGGIFFLLQLPDNTAKMKTIDLCRDVEAQPVCSRTPLSLHAELRHELRSRHPEVKHQAELSCRRSPLDGLVFAWTESSEQAFTVFQCIR